MAEDQVPDLKSGYWEVEVRPGDREKTASLPDKDHGNLM